jgi:hypothetical protein
VNAKTVSEERKSCSVRLMSNLLIRILRSCRVAGMD